MPIAFYHPNLFKLTHLKKSVVCVVLLFSTLMVAGQGSNTLTTDALKASSLDEMGLVAQDINLRLTKIENDLLTDTLADHYSNTFSKINSQVEAFFQLENINNLDEHSLSELKRYVRKNELYDTDLQSLQSRIAERIRNLTETKDFLLSTREMWFLNLQKIRDEKAFPFEQQALDILNTSKKLIDKINTKANAYYTLQTEVGKLRNSVIETNERIEASFSSSDRFLDLNSPPLWTILINSIRDKDNQNDWKLIILKEEIIGSLHYDLQKYSTGIKINIILLVLFSLVFRHIHNSHKRRTVSNSKVFTDLQASVFRRPISAAIVFSLIFSKTLYSGASDVLGTIIVCIASIPALILIKTRNNGRTYFYVLAIIVLLYVLASVTMYMNQNVLYVFLSFTLSLVTALFYFYLAKNKIFESRIGTTLKFSNYLVWASSFISLMATLSILAGNINLGNLLLHGALDISFIWIIMSLLFLLSDSILRYIYSSHYATRLRIIRLYYDEIIHWSTKIVRILFYIWWFLVVLKSFKIRDWINEEVHNILHYPIQFGSIDITLMGILAFIFTIWLTAQISRFLRFVMEEEVLLRMNMKRGMPGTIALITRYSILSIGFLIAVAAAGIDLKNITIILGALGVGIGFGLQNIFNNIVSGIILAFERPIQAGDAVQVGELFGHVKEIGMRSSIIRTFDGAEVIVPNGNLLSNNLINWTLSDRQRRLEVNIGVAYGTNPIQVLDILRKVAASHELVLTAPAPLPLFIGYGDSSLNFRVYFWTGEFDNGLTIKSDVTTQLYAELQSAAIEIPFPQRDLHIKTDRTRTQTHAFEKPTESTQSNEVKNADKAPDLKDESNE